MTLLSSTLSDPRNFRIALILIGAACAAWIYFAYHNFADHKSERGAKKAKGPLLLLNLDKAGSATPSEPLPSAPSEKAPAPVRAPHIPAFVTLKKPWALADLLRAFLIALSLVVAAGFALILLPQPAINRMTQDLQARHQASQQEKVAFLYLGDEVKNNEFQIRGVVRNITTDPIEQLDAAVRFFSHDGSVLETTVVRMNKETIAPDETAQFELVYPNYKMEFAGYAVEFKLRQGDVVPYKDMRPNRAQSSAQSD